MAERLEKSFVDFFSRRIVAEELLGVLAGRLDFGDGAEPAAAGAAHHDGFFGRPIGGLE